jgi:hypothetical protein
MVGLTVWGWVAIGWGVASCVVGVIVGAVAGIGRFHDGRR